MMKVSDDMRAPQDHWGSLANVVTRVPGSRAMKMCEESGIDFVKSRKKVEQDEAWRLTAGFLNK